MELNFDRGRDYTCSLFFPHHREFHVMRTFFALTLITFSASVWAGPTIVMLGAPGSGKGTLGKTLAAHYGVPHVSSGDIIREQIARNTVLGQKARAITERGGLLPDTPETIAPLIEILRQTLAAHPGGFVLDGFPRSEFQARALEQIMIDLGRPVDAAVMIDVSDKTVITRLASRVICPRCQRSYQLGRRGPHAPRTSAICDDDGTALVRRKDDTPESIERRLATHHERNPGVIKFYQDRQRLVQVDGVHLTEAMRPSLLAQIDQHRDASRCGDRLDLKSQP